MKPKFELGQPVSINGSGVFNIKEIAPHGDNHCDCCTTDKMYFMYRVSLTLWVNEEQLIARIVN